MPQTGQTRTVLVTGGGQGIGAAVAEAFAAKGDRVIIWEKDGEAAAERVELIRNRGGECQVMVVDISREDEVKAGVQRLIEQGITIQVIVNNAGVSRPTPLAAPMSDWDAVVNTNLRGQYLVVKYAAPLMSRGGAIINIASTRALMSEPDWHAYAAAKGGLLALTHSLAVTLGPQGIRVNAISPGWIDVSPWQKRTNRQPVQLRDIDHAQHPAGRVGRPEDIAAACLFLASPEAGFITGANLVVDGGMTVKMIYAE
ncbi:SDR family NAD(P)-dependent oxidoreductase [Sporolituus thermophilus]|uniref:NAD(P)-dependent dehydrogenase, short-chain alcohol dehydrogenase family n=1 Tax=Sporolituus thermophilus DSM 23256 TaxID=1123285 RepID=A0A1G7J279_9FIRM|nr:SDR family oxidoreductase [Sporolituus thermophilus]SDF19102.1 hypothetical protein SAMN05660235_00721 [Sporolituus thermophilus DSM 23256]